jgi:chaperonin GroEL
MKNKILYNKDAQKAFKEGVDLVANTVKVTLGKKGRNVMCVRDGMLPIITKDGVSIAREVQHSNPIINAGAMAVKQVAVKTVEDAGDGTTSSCVLAQAIVDFAQEALETTNAITIKNGIDFATSEVVKHLKKISQKVNSTKRIRQIAEISSNGDKEISKLIVEAIKKVGKFGLIKIEVVESTISSVEISKGYEFDSPFSSWGWITNHEKLIAEFKDMNVLLYEGHISKWEDLIIPINSITSEDGLKVEGILIISDSIDPKVESQLLEYKSKGYNFMWVKSPSFGARRTETLIDIAILLNTQVFSDEKGNGLENVTAEKLGKVKKVVVDSNKTVLIGGDGEVIVRINTIQEQLKHFKGSQKDKDYIKERIGKLNGGIALINIGGYSDVERREKSDRVEDALCAVKASLEEGFTVGGGTTYLQISKMLDSVKTTDNNMIGLKIIQSALLAPFIQIYENAGIDGKKHIDYLQHTHYGEGLDIETGEYVNFIDRGIIDPTKVERVALENASSIASTFLTIGAITYNSEPIIRG